MSGFWPARRCGVLAGAVVPDADKDRLVKQCTAKAAPCVTTVTGAETKTGIKAATVRFYN